ncbi:Crp/Fnr family transcriptional regulator [Allomuricauda sp. d1]|uniref:Crp/Fnr family transcriptional regulator n=1 Tax=Allomuricauda sp. d1 TaxID=3136725 RepID=UPI0031E1FFEE
MEHSNLELLKSVFKGIAFTGEEELSFAKLWKERHFKQNGLITEAGSIERYFYVVIEGVQAIYLLDQKGEKVVLGFSYAGSPSGVFDSFIHQKPSDTFLEALKPSRLLAISRNEYLHLFEKHPELHQWGHYFFRDILFGRLFREVELLTLSAEERYVAFMRRCPEELKVIPQKYLASYLNMKPETFSRLRASVSY